MRRLAAVFAALVAALVLAAPAAPFTPTNATVLMDDGVELETTLYLPDGTPPEAGWPGIMMLHGLGSDRRTMNALAEGFFAAHGYAVLTYDARGHFQSGGLVTLAGPREIADVRALTAMFAARADVDDAHIGAFGMSYGGGQTLLAAAAGVPFAAIVTVETWTDLYGALFPGNLSKSGIVGGFINQIPQGKLDPQLAFVRTDAILGTNLDRLRRLGAERSVAQALGTMSVPTLMLQGRRDFAFGIDQATQAYLQLKGPKRLFLGNHGHAPSTFPASDTDYAMTLARRWYDRFLKGAVNGVDTEPNVEIAPDPWRGAPVPFAGLPPTRTLSYPLRGIQTIGAAGKVTRIAATATAALETFGSGTVRVTARATGGWRRLVALLTATTPGGRVIVVSAGGVPASAGTRRYSIPLISGVTLIPKGSRLRVTFGSTTSGTAGGLLYLDFPMRGAARLTVRDASLMLPVLTGPVSG